MKIEAFVLCDAATNYQGKLNLLGTFDTIFTNNLPILYPFCSIAVRLRFSQIEEGEHKLTINFSDTAGKLIIQPLNANMKVSFSKDGPKSIATNMILNIQGLKLENFGEYTISLAIDGRHESSLPLFIKETPKNVKETSEPSQYN